MKGRGFWWWLRRLPFLNWIVYFPFTEKRLYLHAFTHGLYRSNRVLGITFGFTRASEEQAWHFALYLNLWNACSCLYFAWDGGHLEPCEAYIEHPTRPGVPMQQCTALRVRGTKFCEKHGVQISKT